ncbi:hypothetical protein NDN01_00195 [Sphingomonas sp. QA11]|uniref:hypothetical protein n=1 Tax=Sphingomonas sp. QA11 TaxID=2950605 RepID=UPI002349D6CF|nr:hypothetical protein [Sphingomonas sp. QA11]WCM27396.1 hypothetical protein NDN01_00195 [Sphingomonas sp. QA11]
MSTKLQAAVRPAVLFIIAYLLTNIVNSAVTLSYQAIVRLPSADEIGLSWLKDPAYQATVPWHALISFVIFVCTALWLNHHHAKASAWRVGSAWALTAIVIDAIVYVGILGSTRWGLPPSDYYIGNQPWITLTYLGLLLAPVTARLIKLRGTTQRPSLT